MLVAVIGLLGFGLRHIDAPIAPVMIGLILGPAAEQHLRRALSISQGDWTVFLTRPLSADPPRDRGDPRSLWGLSRRQRNRSDESSA